MSKKELARLFYPVLSTDIIDQIFYDMLPQWDHNIRSESFPKSAEKIVNDVYVFQLALAGYSEEQLKIEVGDNYISVKSDKVPKEEDLLLAGRAFTWSRKDLNNIWDFQNTEASFKDGLLTIRVPKKESAKPKLLRLKT